jgi:cytidyltransferase-like protein
MARLKEASIHGRFQPFHNGHLEYFRWAKARADRVFVGITQIYNQHGGVFPGAEHRGLLDNNPFNFFERFRLIEESLLSSGYSLEDFRIIPFPIEDPFRLTTFLPTDVKCFTTKHTDWNEHKVKILGEAGFDVEVLAEDEAHVSLASGTQIRALLRARDNAWRDFVPNGAHGLIEELVGKGRLNFPE